MRWTRAASGVRSEAQGGLLSVSVELHARRRRCLRTVKSCGPDASTLASSLAEARSAQPGRTKPSIREATVAKQPDRRGEHEISRKTIACGNVGCSGVLVVNTRVRSTQYKLHTGLRVQWASGVPHAFCFQGAETKCNASGASRREGEVVSETLSTSLPATNAKHLRKGSSQ